MPFGTVYRCLVLIQSLLGKLRLSGGDTEGPSKHSDGDSSLLLSEGKTDELISIYDASNKPESGRSAERG